MAYGHVNERNPHKPVERPSVESSGPSNVYAGLHTGPVEMKSDIDLKAIPPNGARPVEVTPGSKLFGNFIA